MADNMKIVITADSAQATNVIKALEATMGNLEKQTLRMTQSLQTSMTPQGFDASRQLVDRFGNSLLDVAKNVVVVEAASKSMWSKMADGVAITESAVSKFGVSFGGLSSIMKVGALAGAALALHQVGSALTDYTLESAKAAEVTVNMADRLGVSINQVKQLSAMSKIAGVDLGSLENSARIIAVALEDTSGAGAKASKALRDLGISTYDVSGQQREYGSVMLDLLKKLANVEDANKRVAIATAVLGRGAKELLPLIKNYNDLQAAIKELSIGTGSEAQTQFLAKLDDEVDKLEIAWAKFKKNVADGFAPILLPIIAQVTKIVSGNTQLQKNDAEANAYWDKTRQQGAEANNPALFLARRMREQGAIGGNGAKLAYDQYSARVDAMPGRASAFQASELKTSEGRLARIDADLKDALPKAVQGVSGAAEIVSQLRREREQVQQSIDAAKKAKAELEAQAKKLAEFRKKFFADDHAKKTLGKLEGTGYEVKQVEGTSTVNFGYYSELFKKRQDLEEQAFDLQSKNDVELLKQHEVNLSMRKDVEIQKLSEVQGLTLQQSQAVNLKKLDIEQKYFADRLDLLKLQLETEKQIELAKAGENAEIRAAIERKYMLAAAQVDKTTQLEIEKAKSDAITANGKLAYDTYKKNFDSIKDSVGSLFDAMVSRTRSWGDVLKGVLNTFFLAPLKESFSTAMATLMTGGRQGSGSQSGGLTGLLSGLFGNKNGGIVPGVTTGTTPPFIGSTSSVTAIPGMVGFGMTSNGQIVSSLGKTSGLSKFMGNGTGIMGTSSAQGIFGSSGKFGSYGGLVQGGLMMGGSMLATDGWSRGGWTGAAELAGGGASIGFALGGPLGAGIGAVVGGGVGIFRALFSKSQADKIIKQVKDMYGVTIDKQFAKSLADQSKGMDLRVFLASSTVREQIQMYAQMTNQGSKMNTVDDKARGVFLSQSNGVLSQAGSYSGNTLYGYTSSLSSAAGLNTYAPNPNQTSTGGSIVLDKSGTKDFLTTLFVGGIVENPKAVQSASNNAISQSYGRTSASINLNDPLAARV